MDFKARTHHKEAFGLTRSYYETLYEACIGILKGFTGFVMGYILGAQLRWYLPNIRTARNCRCMLHAAFFRSQNYHNILVKQLSASMDLTTRSEM